MNRIRDVKEELEKFKKHFRDSQLRKEEKETEVKLPGRRSLSTESGEVYIFREEHSTVRTYNQKLYSELYQSRKRRDIPREEKECTFKPDLTANRGRS